MLLYICRQHGLTFVSCSATWIAVCVCRVMGPVRILDVPFARAMKIISWRENHQLFFKEAHREDIHSDKITKSTTDLVLQEHVHATIVSDVSQQHLGSLDSNFVSVHTWHNTKTWFLFLFWNMNLILAIMGLASWAHPNRLLFVM